MPKTPPYSKEFKREAVGLLRSSGRPVPKLAGELGCESDGFGWPQRDGLKWPHLALVDVVAG